MQDDYSKTRKAWGIAHSLETEIDYYLQETNSKNIVPTKHGLDMMLKHILSEIAHIKEMTKSDPL